MVMVMVPLLGVRQEATTLALPCMGGDREQVYRPAKQQAARRLGTVMVQVLLLEVRQEATTLVLPCMWGQCTDQHSS